MATRTTTTSRTRAGRALSADESDAIPEAFTLQELVVAYFDCRSNKRNTQSALHFEERLEHNLFDLYDELAAGA